MVRAPAMDQGRPSILPSSRTRPRSVHKKRNALTYIQCLQPSRMGFSRPTLTDELDGLNCNLSGVDFLKTARLYSLYQALRNFESLTPPRPESLFMHPKDTGRGSPPYLIICVSAMYLMQDPAIYSPRSFPTVLPGIPTEDCSSQPFLQKPKLHHGQD